VGFDPARFALWLEILFEAGESAVVTRLCELPLDFVILAVARLVLVVDIDRLGVELSDDEEELELVEKALDSNACEEWEEFRLIARDQRAFDTLVTALFALDREHHDLLRKILERCAAISGEYIEDNGGLYAVLTSDEMLESDARAERDDRRAAEGYVAASDARSFLALARQGTGRPGERDPVMRAYFRELDREHEAHATRPAGRRAARTTTAKAKPGVARLGKLLAEVTGTAAQPVTALVPTAGGPLLGRALAELQLEDPALHAERLEELTFLANVLIAGEPNPGGRRFRPIEALETALSVCDEALVAELGASHVLHDDAPPHGAPPHDARLRAAVTLVRSRHLDELFRRGWYERHARPKSR